MDMQLAALTRPFIFDMRVRAGARFTWFLAVAAGGWGGGGGRCRRVARRIRGPLWRRRTGRGTCRRRHVPWTALRLLDFASAFLLSHLWNKILLWYCYIIDLTFFFSFHNCIYRRKYYKVMKYNNNINIIVPTSTNYD